MYENKPRINKVPCLKTNMTGWKIFIFKRKYINSWWIFQLVMLVLRGVTSSGPRQNPWKFTVGKCQKGSREKNLHGIHRFSSVERQDPISIHHLFFVTLPETNIAPKNWPSQKERMRLRTIICQVSLLLVSGRVCQGANIAGWNIPIFHRKYIFNPGPCSGQLC